MKRKIVLSEDRSGGYMKKLNIVAVYDQEEKNILLCYREKNPYKGLYNLVGGKIEDGEENFAAAYRELNEETGITKDDICLSHVMTFFYPMSDIELQVYAGKLNKTVVLKEEVNHLYWFSKEEDFFDSNRFAGEGNIGHLLAQVQLYHDEFLK